MLLIAMTRTRENGSIKTPQSGHSFGRIVPYMYRNQIMRGGYLALKIYCEIWKIDTN